MSVSVFFKATLVLISASAFLMLSACTSSGVKPADPRNPAQIENGTGDVDSSTMRESRETYKLPITRNGQTVTRVAFYSWSGEWPMPVIDVRSGERRGTTTIPALSSLRDTATAEHINCSIKNGVYHPWAGKDRLDPSAITYYSLTAVEDYDVVRATSLDNGDGSPKTRIPRGARINNVVYYGENFCGATLQNGNTEKVIAANCEFFQDNRNFRRRAAVGGEFSEQWLHVQCEEKGADGKNIKAFIQDSALLAVPGVTTGCPTSYGNVGPAGSCQDPNQ